MENSPILIVHWCGAHPLLNEARAVWAAGYVASIKGKVGMIIFSGGHTRWKHKPSEAQDMYTWFSTIIGSTHMAALRCLVEENSCDTLSSAEKSLKLVRDQTDSQLMLLSQKFHLPRIQDTYTSLGIPRDRQTWIDTDEYIPPDLYREIHRLPAYWKIRVQEPFICTLESSPFFHGIGRAITTKRIQK